MTTLYRGVDENVPTWHSRELVGLIKTWRSDADATLAFTSSAKHSLTDFLLKYSFFEDENKPHWYPEIFTSQRVQYFLSAHLNRNNSLAISVMPKEFILTVAIPAESGSLHGFFIRELKIPGRSVVSFMHQNNIHHLRRFGRLARLRVFNHNNMLQVHTNNVQTFSLTPSHGENITIDGMEFELSRSLAHEIWFTLESESWKVSDPILQGPLPELWIRYQMVNCPFGRLAQYPAFYVLSHLFLSSSHGMIIKLFR